MTELATLILQLEATIRDDIRGAKADLLREMYQIKERQDIANGRTGKLEDRQGVIEKRYTEITCALDNIQQKTVEIEQKTNGFGNMSNKQKAALGTLAVGIAAFVVELLHQLVPAIVEAAKLLGR